ncbi:MAG: 50S ribosomal protein L22 [Bacteroidales bacterium]|nr:50S ribosomal protein L22 [Bacteroidales bacterium]
MGERKRLKAIERKEIKKTLSYAKLNNCPTSPRKMRLVANMVRGKKINEALGILKNTKRESSIRLYKLLMSAISNWQKKNDNEKIENANLYISEIFVDGGKMLKRVRTAPQGRVHRIRKRSNHVTLQIDKMPPQKENKRKVREDAKQNPDSTTAVEQASTTEVKE